MQSLSPTALQFDTCGWFSLNRTSRLGGILVVIVVNIVKSDERHMLNSKAHDISDTAEAR